MTFKPMLSGKVPEDLSQLPLPVLASPKLDGIRCIVRDGVALSRKLLPIPNRFVQAQLKDLPDGLDGELMLSLPGNFNEVQSAVMSIEGEPDFKFCVFDWLGLGGFLDRYTRLYTAYNEGRHERVDVVPHYEMRTIDKLLELEAAFLGQGFEGVMIRSYDGPYKYGRSTAREGYLLKLKRFEDAEAVILGAEELMHNANEAGTNELGLTKRSSAKAGKVPADMLGALVCQRDDGVQFNIGAGFTEQQRRELWDQHQNTACGLRGLSVTYKFQPDPSNPKGAPRFPVFLRMRAD